MLKKRWAIGFCKDLIYALLGKGCGVSRNDERVDTLAYITCEVQHRIYLILNTYAATTNILKVQIKTIKHYQLILCLFKYHIYCRVCLYALYPQLEILLDILKSPLSKYYHGNTTENIIKHSVSQHLNDISQFQMHLMLFYQVWYGTNF